MTHDPKLPADPEADEITPTEEEVEDALDEALEESFPASDPPSVTRHLPDR
ncbi:MAG: hypothetical protein JWP35_111 [Caulobacter sp.]|nr:hypothetical protein [Caulobacter sp.]